MFLPREKFRDIRQSLCTANGDSYSPFWEGEAAHLKIAQTQMSRETSKGMSGTEAWENMHLSYKYFRVIFLLLFLGCF